MRLTREQTADIHWNERERWLTVTLKRDGRRVFGIPSLSNAQKYHLCDGDGCSCADFRFRGLSGLRIGHAGAHLPCSHILAVRRLLDESLAAEAVADMRYVESARPE